MSAGRVILVVGVLSQAALVAYGPPAADSYVYHSPVARFVLDRAPWLYNPVPEVFAERTIHGELPDGAWYAPTVLPIGYVRSDGVVTKILIDEDTVGRVAEKWAVDPEYLAELRYEVECAENLCRLAHSPSELVAMADKIEPKIKAERRANQVQAGRTAGRGMKKIASAPGAEAIPKGETRALVAQALGVGHIYISRARVVVEAAKKDPEKLTYSSSGVGGNNHLAGALFAEAAGIKLTHVPYKGTGPALADVISGVITMNFSSLPPAVGQVKAGNLKALAVTGEKRIKSLPDVPTLKEQRIDVVVNGWHGLFAPAKTPDAILDKIEKDTKQAMKDPKWEEALAKDGLELPPDRTRAQFAKFVADEHAFWGKKLKELKVEME